MECCSICLDEEEKVAFKCSARQCVYQMCAPCVREAFKDSSGLNSSKCQECGNPSALEMIQAVCGPGAIKAVEQSVRSSIEFEVKAAMVKKEAAKEALVEINVRARKIFNDFTDQINLRCPRCNVVFHDYDGCNALSCSSCRAGFCAICLQDCGTDAHSHVRTMHGGNLFDKGSFETSKRKRAAKMVENLLRKELEDEPFELKQLVENHIEKAELTSDSDTGGTDSKRRTRRFIQNATDSLLKTVKNDRLSILSDAESYRPGRGFLQQQALSPRSTIPNEFRVTMVVHSGNIYNIRLDHFGGDAGWKSVPLDDVEKELKDIPDLDSVINLKQSLKSAVLAVEGRQTLIQSRSEKPDKEVRLGENQICISMSSVSNDGSIGERVHFHEDIRVLGFNPNLRMLLLEKHIVDTPDINLMFGPLTHLVGDGKPVPLLSEILRPIPETLNTLNEEQIKVAHPLRLKTAMEVAGPPGTGKTKTIVELVRSLLECTDYDIIVMSERNGAINAIAEKFKEVALETRRDTIEVKDALIWLSLMTYGSGKAMGASTKLFTLEEKLRYHPDLAKLKEQKMVLEKATSSLVKSMRDTLADKIDEFGDVYDVDRAYNRSNLLRKDRNDDLPSPLLTIRFVKETEQETQRLISAGRKMLEADVSEVVHDRSAILGGLIDIRTDVEMKENPKDWNNGRVLQLLTAISEILKDSLAMEIFNEDHAEHIFCELSKVKKNWNDEKRRLEEDLPKAARLHMSTIGSSHKLPVRKVKDSSLADLLDNLSLNDDSYDDSSEEVVERKETVVIFDESGCIPDYELLGLSRLGCDIKSLVLVGDKYQLPPYNPCQGKPKQSPRNGRRPSYIHQSNGEIKSLLDASALTVDDAKVMLSTQYRVPRDIADYLNARVYKGNYNTCPEASYIPQLGLEVRNVREDNQPRRKYVNSFEVEKGLELIDELSVDYEISSILVITPYKNQQREFQFQLKRRGMKNPPDVLTIDQCQGQEADAVILSLVQKPTRFLNMNRLNVALSRVRKKLYVLVDTQKLRAACDNSKWDAALLASDLL